LTEFKTANNYNAANDINAIYYNGGDLGVGRDMHCWKIHRNDHSPAGDAACYVTNYGASFVDPSLSVDDALAQVIERDPFKIAATVAMAPTPFRAAAALALALAAIVWPAAPVRAAACASDIDCPGTACGSQVCDWVTGTVACVPAGTKWPQGADGECATDADCKCAPQGARCFPPFCTFTVPPDAGAAGTTGSAGASGAGGGGAGSGGGGSSGATGGSSGATGGSSGATGGVSGAAGGSRGCGCLIAGAPPGRRDDGMLCLLGAALTAQAARRRRRTRS